jgi:hypothetical protein
MKIIKPFEKVWQIEEKHKWLENLRIFQETQKSGLH